MSVAKYLVLCADMMITEPLVLHLVVTIVVKYLVLCVATIIAKPLVLC